MHSPVVAVWMVTYNHASFIRQAIESVMDQETTFSYVLYLGEDASVDDTPAICKELQGRYGTKIKLYLNKENLGATRNGIKMYEECFSSGAKYVALLEGDDYWMDRHKLQKQFEFMERNPEYSACFGQCRVLNLITGTIDRDYTPKVESKLELADILNKHMIPTSSFFFRRSMVPIIPKMMIDVISGDIFIETLLSIKGPIRFMNEYFSTYRKHHGGLTRVKEVICDGESKLTDLYIYFFKATSGPTKELFRYAVAERYLFRIHKLRCEGYFYSLWNLAGFIPVIFIFFRRWKVMKPLLIALILQIFPFLKRVKLNNNFA